MKEAMRKGLVSLITGAATVASPMAFAAQDNAGMHYTSAAEGFYASIRTRYTSGSGTKDSGSHVGESFSRFGVRGTNDLGGGMEGFYNYEVAAGENNGDELKTRLRYVGLRGGFGEISVGTQWDDTYNYVTGKTDIAQHDSGAFAWNFRVNNSIQYNTPDLNGFKASLRTILKDDKAGASCDLATTAVASKNQVRVNAAGDAAPHATEEVSIGDPDCDKAVAKDDNDLNSWALSAQYSVQGFNVAATYETIADGLDAVSAVSSLGDGGADGLRSSPGGTATNELDTILTENKDDRNRWGVGASYGQDNWSVASWYGISETRSVTHYDQGAQSGTQTMAQLEDDTAGAIHDEDEEIFSLAAQVTVDKVKVYGVFDSIDNVDGKDGVEKTQGIVGVQYNIGAQSRVWVEYLTKDEDDSKTEDDFVSIGLRHDF